MVKKCNETLPKFEASLRFWPQGRLAFESMDLDRRTVVIIKGHWVQLNLYFRAQLF